MPRILSIVALLLAMCLGALLAFHNQSPTPFHYLAGVVDLPLFVLLLCAFVFGALLALLVMALRLMGLRGQIRQLRRQLRDSETELKNLRNLPLRDV